MNVPGLGNFGASRFQASNYEKVSLAQIVSRELDEFHGVRPLEKPYESKAPPVDINMIDYSA